MGQGNCFFPVHKEGEMEEEEEEEEEGGGGDGGRKKQARGGGGRQGTVEDSQLQCSFLPQYNEVILAIVFSSAQGEKEEKKKEQE